AYDYYSESGINDSWNAIPIPFGSVNKIPLAWVNLFRSEFIIGSGPLFNVNKLYFDKVVVYDRIEEKNGYKPTPESPEIKFRIFKGTGSIGSPEFVDGVKSEYPGFAYVQLYKIVDGVEEPADPLTPDGDVSQLYADIEGIVNDTGTAPERNPIKILYMLFTKPYTGYEGYGLEIDPDDLDFDDAILEANIQGFKIDGAIDRIAEFGEWVDELLRCARASLTEEDGKIKVYVDSAKTYSGVHFDASGVNGYECDISPWTEPEVDAQINRLRLSYSWNFERNDFNKKPGVHEESPLRDPYLKDEAHAVRIGKWNTDTIEFKLIKDDTTAHKLAQYYLKSKVKQLKTTSLVTEVNIPNIDAGDLVKVSYEKFGWVEKEFVVTKIKRNEDSTELDIKEYSIDVYTFVSPGEEPEVPGNPYSPYNIPTKPIMNSLEVVNTILQDGSNQTLIKVEFTHTSENAQMVALYFKEASEPESAFWQLDSTVNKNVITTIWKGRVTGDYNFRLATITSMGVTSPITIEDGDRHYYGQPTEEVPASVHVDTEAPGTPSISIVNPFVGGVSIYITIPDGIPEDFAYFKIFRKLGNSTPALLATYHTSAVFTDSERETVEHSRVYYAVAVDRNGNESAMSAASAASTPLKVSDADLSADAIKMPTGAILSLSAKNCTTASIAEVDGVKDVSGNGNHGQAFGGVEVVDSEMGKAFQFNDINDIIHTNFGAPELNSTDSFTISVWAKYGGGGYSTVQHVVSSGSLISITKYYGNWSFGIGDSPVSAYAPVAVRAGEWIHFALVVQKSSSTATLYANGKPIKTKTGWVWTDITDDLTLSRVQYYWFNGLIAHLKIYGRAISPSEIKTLYMFPDDVAFGQITTDFIGANAVTAGKTLLAAIDDVTGNLNNNVVGELQLVNNAVTEAKIAVNAVNTGQINNQALKAPGGALLSLSAKNCTTASIAEVDGVKDVSGNGNHGQAFGGVAVVNSEYGKAFSFDGVNDYIQTNNPLGLSPEEFTVDCIVYNDGVTATYCVACSRTVLGEGIAIFVLNGKLRFDTGAQWATNISIPLNKYVHLSAVYKKSAYKRLFVNGILAASTDVATECGSVDASRMQFGASAVNASNLSNWLKGLIAQPKIFNRALSPSEIKTLYMFPDDVAFGQITADLVTTGELITKSAQIADAIISNAHIHDLSAEKINAGTIAADRIGAGSINASKLLIGRVGAALNDDPNFEDPSAWIVPINGTFASVTDGQVGGTVARQSVGYGIWRNVKYIPIDRSKTYRVRLWIRTDSAGNGASKPVSIGTNYYTALGGIEDTRLEHGTNIPITTSWQEFSYIINGSDFPPTAKYMRNRIGLFNGTGTGYHEMQDLRIEEVIPATLIQDGSIITEKLAVGAVTAEKLLIGKSGAALNDDPNFEDP
ncbi:LamG domain-containing protein, partial [Bacteroides sp.]|uniref:LamG domain-containing protein n=1 Tax=Bacteroides sp. TaxID=29523 RepID=UPI0026308B4A